MKAAIVTPRFYPVGAVDYSHHRARQLVDAGWDVTVHTPLFIGLQATGNWHGAKVKYYPFKYSFGEFAKSWTPELEGYDLVHFCGGFRHPHTLSNTGKAKVLFSPFYPDKPRNSIVHKVVIPVIDTVWAWRMLKRCNLVLAETKQEESWLHRHGISKTAILPNNIPDEVFGAYSGTEFVTKYQIHNKIIMFLGGHSYIKNVEELIQAVATLKDFDFTLVLGGEGELTDKYKTLISSLGITQRVIFPGPFYDNPKLKFSAYAAASVFVLPSRMEGLGTVALEAMSQKTPVICANAGGLPDIVPDKSYLYPLGYPYSLAESIKCILDDDSESKKLGEACFEKAKEYRYSVIEKRYIDVCNTLVGL